MQVADQQEATDEEPMDDAACTQIISRIWLRNKAYLMEEMRRRLESGDIYILYDVQLFTNNLVRYAFLKRDVQMLDGLSQLFSIACRYLQRDAGGGFKWIYADPDNRELADLFGKEIPLVSSQFLSVVAETIHDISLLDDEYATASMKELIGIYCPVLMDFYDRHLPPFSDWMATALAAPFPPEDDVFSFSVPISDDLMFLLTGITHLLGAARQTPETIALSEKQTEAYEKFIATGCGLLEKRLSRSVLKNFEGDEVTGVNLDLGVWDGYEDYSYSGYDGSSYPRASEQRIVQDVGWDISHARRFVNVFDTLYDNRSVTGLDFPDGRIMTGLANQLVYGTFNRHFDRPLFANFMDGTNGWFRVGYAGRENFGYAPYGLSDAVPTGGYGFWNRFNPDIGRVMDGICGMLRKGRIRDLRGTEAGKGKGGLNVEETGDGPGEMETECGLNAFIEKYFGDFRNPDSLSMLMFLPTRVAYPLHDKVGSGEVC